jgi:putative membrane protein
MKKMIYIYVILALMMCVSNGFAQNTTNSNSNQNTTNSSGNTKTSGKKNSDSKFMMLAATSDMNEIGLSQQALSKSTNEEVKKLAQMMIDDHTKSSEELKPLAASKGVVLPTEMDSKHKSAMGKMTSTSGMEFDTAYVKMMVKDHEKAVALYQKEANGGKDAEARAFAAKTLPVVQMHLDMSRKLMSSMSGSKQANNNKMSGM